MSLLDSIKAQDTNYTEADIKESANYLKKFEVKLAFHKFWLGHLAHINSALPKPFSGCNWKEPDYASGLQAWEEICAINGWK